MVSTRPSSVHSIICVRTAEGCNHRSAKRMCIDGPTVFKIGEEQFGRGDERTAGIR
jgi:hypothetical protein